MSGKGFGEHVIRTTLSDGLIKSTKLSRVCILARSTCRAKVSVSYSCELTETKHLLEIQEYYDPKTLNPKP